MGISLAATIKNSGYAVLWAAQGRSEQSAARADEHDLTDVGTVAALFDRSDALVSVCPPHAAEEVADQVIACGFEGIDGGIIGEPAWEPGRTWLYLSGAEAETAVPFFSAGPLETELVGPEIGQASALKMVFAAYTKGHSALLALVLAGAESLGVRPALEQQWERYWPDFSKETEQSVRQVTAKAWRFEGEMQEIAATFESVGLPGGFHESAAEIYRRMAGFKGAAQTPEIEAVLAALAQSAEIG